jgi:hypothetical protein
MPRRSTRNIEVVEDPDFIAGQPDVITLCLKRLGGVYHLAVSTAAYRNYVELPQVLADGTTRLRVIGVSGPAATWLRTGVRVIRGADLEDTLLLLAGALHDSLCQALADELGVAAPGLEMDPLF